MPLPVAAWKRGFRRDKVRPSHFIESQLPYCGFIESKNALLIFLDIILVLITVSMTAFFPVCTCLGAIRFSASAQLNNSPCHVLALRACAGGRSLRSCNGGSCLAKRAFSSRQLCGHQVQPQRIAVLRPKIISL